ncbi:MAG: 2-keto-4-pentenoate hydratase/2-oxohepta-3-ene-1,7-dioic acid hydratase in catechol pathway [Arenicella sp.]|jgi:2-keto-4-pentenoate hydratase/2-oxohepta-3-ene-1,7-dioic acid hydratase in catechol pathway
MNSINYRNQQLQPSKVVCIGRNYAAHIEELDNEVPDQPVIFVKPNSAISSQIRLHSSQQIDYEAEITFLVIDKQLRGVGIGLDLTKRQIQWSLKSKGLPWERAKAFDGSAVFSDFVDLKKVTNTLRLELEINGQLMQQGGVSLMLNKPTELVADITSFMSFENGDILMTGTPSGIGIVVMDDVFIGKIYDGEQLLVQQQWKVQG